MDYIHSKRTLDWHQWPETVRFVLMMQEISANLCQVSCHVESIWIYICLQTVFEISSNSNTTVANRHLFNPLVFHSQGFCIFTTTPRFFFHLWHELWFISCMTDICNCKWSQNGRRAVEVCSAPNRAFYHNNLQIKYLKKTVVTEMALKSAHIQT